MFSWQRLSRSTKREREREKARCQLPTTVSVTQYKKEHSQLGPADRYTPKSTFFFFLFALSLSIRPGGSRFISPVKHIKSEMLMDL